jgi:hypothetical protein
MGDEAVLEAFRSELGFRQIARALGGEGLIGMAETPSHAAPAMATLLLMHWLA